MVLLKGMKKNVTETGNIKATAQLLRTALMEAQNMPRSVPGLI